MSNFDNSYKRLNLNQKTAVDYIEGPLLVIAGPGTGKTQLLSLRAANILTKTDALPENILCLTFTESGAAAMRSRLINTIGEDAYKITISTYHSFGSEIIRRYPSFFSGNNLTPINRLKVDAIIRDLQKDLPFTSELKNPNLVGNIAELISDAKQSLLTPKDLELVADANLNFISEASSITRPLTNELRRASVKSLASFEKLVLGLDSQKLPSGVEPLSTLWNRDLELAIEKVHETNKSTSLSAWKAKYLMKDDEDQQIAKGQTQNARLKDFSALYTQYLKYLKDNNLYDYDDMILLAIDAMKSHKDLRFNLQERYLYIMLDEYQDTNQAQAELTYLLTDNEVYEGKPNVMAVGDDDQAIYAFQGARHSNMLDFVKQYREVKQITLTDNYRSGQALIDLSSSVANQISERLSKMLNVNKSFKASRKSLSKIQNLNFSNEIDEYVWLAKNIQTDKSSDIAIIAPEHKYLERASAYLIQKGVSISYERRENILDNPLIDMVITILRLLKSIEDKDSRLTDALLANVLNYDFWELPTETVWNLSWRAYDEHEPWLKLMLNQPKTREIGLMLVKMAANSLVYRYDFIIDQIIGLSDIVINDPKLKSSRSPLLEFYSDSKDNLVIAKLLQNLMVLKQQFKDFNTDNDRPLMITDLVDFIDQLKSSNVKLANDFSYGQSGSKVKLMTAHSVKGLEFESVYLLSFVNEVWGVKNGNFNRLSLPPNLEYIRVGAEDSDDESLRLLYVALTRAKDQLTTLSYTQDANAKLTTPLKYLDPSKTDISTAVKPELIPLWQQEETKVDIPTDLKAVLKNRLQFYALNPTELNTFLDVRNAGPQNFYRSILLKYKAPVSPRVDYGSAVHDSLDWLQQRLSLDSKLPTLNQLLIEFEKSLLKRRLLTHDFKKLKEQGIRSLSAYYQANKDSFSKDDLSEHSFKSDGLTIGNVRLSGKIDKIAVNKADKKLEVIDYKTGRGYRSWSAQPKLHLYRNQLYFYKLLIDGSLTFKDYEVSGAKLDFVEPDITSGNLNQLPLVYNDQEMQRFVSLIQAVWQHVEDLSFPGVSAYKPSLSGIIKFEDDLINGRI